jgi:predicted murein hydrolase (TIGR00659 family)
MNAFFEGSAFFGIFVTVAAYLLGIAIYEKWRYALFNPMLLADIFVAAVLLLFRVKYDDYARSAHFLSVLLIPATVCLAVPLYKQLDTLKQHFSAICTGILAGVFANILGVSVLSKLFGFSHELYVTLLPKSITTPIGIGLSEEFGGIVTLTVASIVVTGIVGNVIAEPLCKMFRITEPVARGIGIGTASHAVGTARAFQIGEVEGAMSGLAIVLAGVCTVLIAPFFSHLV